MHFSLRLLVKKVVFTIALMVTFSSFSSVADDNLENLINQYVSDYHLPSLSVVVIKNGATIVSGTYGEEQALSPHTPTYIASISKSITSAAILLLQSAGELQIDDPVINYLPELKLDYPSGSKLTIRQLLNHTSGIQNFTYTYDENGQISRKKALEQISGYQPSVEPGKAFYYNNANYDLLGFIIERVSGQTYTRFVSESIFSPLGMDNSATIATANVSVPGYTNYFGFLWQKKERINVIEAPSGFVVSSAEDVAKFMQFALTGKAANGQTLLDSNELKQWRSFTEQSDYALGLQLREVDDKRIYGHYGSLNTFASGAFFDPESSTIVSITTNKVSIPLLTLGLPEMMKNIHRYVSYGTKTEPSFLRYVETYYPLVILLEILLTLFALLKLKKRLRCTGVSTKQRVGSVVNVFVVGSVPVLISMAMGRPLGYLWLWQLAPDLFTWFAVSVLLALVKVWIMFRSPGMMDNKRMLFSSAE